MGNPFDVLKELNAYNEKLIESSSKLRTKLESKSRTLKNLKTLMKETNSIFQREDEGYLERMKNYNFEAEIEPLKIRFLDDELLNEPVKPLMPETKLKTAQSAAKLAERVLRSNPPSPGLPRSEKNQKFWFLLIYNTACTNWLGNWYTFVTFRSGILGTCLRWRKTGIAREGIHTLILAIIFHIWRNIYEEQSSRKPRLNMKLKIQILFSKCPPYERQAESKQFHCIYATLNFLMQKIINLQNKISKYGRKKKKKKKI